MAAMTRRLPNLNQLRAFEAAARHLSFKNAAEELHVTHAAISHQIKALEEDLGRPLFRRLTRKVELLPEAADLAERLAANLDDIAEAVARIREEKSKGHLKISAVPAFRRVTLNPGPTVTVSESLEMGAVGCPLTL